MADLPTGYLALDGLSALLAMAVAGGFLWVWRWSRQALHFLVAIGFLLVGLGFLFVTLSHYAPGAELGEGGGVDAGRVACQLGGAVLLMLAYASYHGAGRPPAVAIAFATAAGTVLLVVLFWLVPPVGEQLPRDALLATAYGMMAIAYVTCTVLSGYGWHKRPTLGRALVPLAFLCWTFSTYTWVLIAMDDDDRLLPVVYAWRFIALALMIWAMLRRPRVPSTRLADAPS